jgi:pteridine reductase
MAENGFSLAVVTGAAHRLGKVFAISLARQGYAILLHHNRSTDKVPEAANEIQRLGVPVYPFQADLSKIPGIASLFSFIDSLPHPLQVLVNSAAIMPRGDIQSLSVEQWDEVMNLNLRTPFLMSQQAAKRMQAGGLVVNISDAGSAKNWTGFPAYSISKTSLEKLTRILAKSLAPAIRVNAIAPGLIMPSGGMDNRKWRELIERLPLKRPTTTDEIALALEYLLKSGSVTGQTIVVDGGYSLI